MKEISYPSIKEKLVTFITNKVQESGASGAVMGLSGGIDSTLAAYLSVEALGSENVLGLLLPERGITSEQDIADALLVAKTLGIEYKVIEISPVLQSFSKTKGLIYGGNIRRMQD
jgi:NAD+ synthase